jgi:hypothetical protein
MVQVFDMQNVELHSRIYLVKKHPESLYIILEELIIGIQQKYTTPRNSSAGL